MAEKSLIGGPARVIDPNARPAHFANLPADFVFGTATAAYQIEGAVNEGGRGPSIWDVFTHTPGKILHNETGDLANDHYHRWEADLDLMAELGLPAYRLNFSWARLQPTGRGPLNPEGVKFYRDLLAGCHKRGIKPFVTIYHWDLPQALQEEGGWAERPIVERFAEYTALLIDAFSDLAQDWITINEAWCVAYLGHSWGMQAPGIRDDRVAIRVAHHVLLAHGRAVAEFRAKAPQLKVGITNILSNVEPYSANPADVDAAAKLDASNNLLFLNPLYKGDYGAEVYDIFEPLGLNRVPAADALVQPGDLAEISAATDFVGINHYHNMRAKADPNGFNGIDIIQAEPNDQSSWNWPNTPWALHKILKRVNLEFSQLPVYITENGITLNDYTDTNGVCTDLDRIDYLNGYIDAVAQAIGEGVPVKGYFAWSFMDNFEWAEGYSKRFGLVYVDYPTQLRYPKASAFWYRDLIAEHKEKASK